MNWDPDDKERVAFHEAGHAVVAWSFDLTVEGIYLDLVNQSGHTEISADEGHLQPFEQIAKWYAGCEAEETLRPPVNWDRGRDDRFRIGQILDKHTPGETRERQELREQGRACAVARLLKYETEVREVARHLVEHHHLDWVRFEEIMRAP